jgi:hypothetical protein
VVLDQHLDGPAQTCEIERFAQEGEYPCLSSLGSFVRGREPRHEDCRQGAGGGDRPEHLETGGLGQVEVEDREIEPLPAGEADGFSPEGGGGDGPPLAGQVFV